MLVLYSRKKEIVVVEGTPWSLRSVCGMTAPIIVVWILIALKNCQLFFANNPDQPRKEAAISQQDGVHFILFALEMVSFFFKLASFFLKHPDQSRKGAPLLSEVEFSFSIYRPIYWKLKDGEGGGGGGRHLSAGCLGKHVRS